MSQLFKELYLPTISNHYGDRNLSVCVCFEIDLAFSFVGAFEFRLVLDFVACVHFWIIVSVLFY